MLNIQIGVLVLRMTALDRSKDESDLYQWIETYIEYRVPSVNVEYSMLFTQDEIEELYGDLRYFFQSLKNQETVDQVSFTPLEKLLSMDFRQVGHKDIAECRITMRPEANADSLTVTDTFYLDQSYFDSVLIGLKAIANFPSL
jgi:hypothetical protein